MEKFYITVSQDGHGALMEETLNVFKIFKENLLGKRPTGSLEKDCLIGCVITKHATKRE
jgi:hypothetical protein